MVDIVRKILKIFEENKLWDEGIELIGSWCLLLYQKHFKVKSFPLRTQDIDFAIPFPYKGKRKLDLVKLLENLGFELSFYPDGSFYMWNAELKIEFLAPVKGRGTKHALDIKTISIKATPLRFLDILLKDQVFVKEKSLKIAIPSPLSFCLHKLLIAQRRKDKSKKIKDIEQAVYILEIIDKKQFKKEYIILPKKWKRYIVQSLEEAKTNFPLQEESINDALITLQT